MIVHTHVSISSAFPYTDIWKLVALWSHSWEAQGFTPIVTTQELFKTCSSVHKYLAKIKSFPSINPDGFDCAAFSRWVAAHVISGKLGVPIVSTECDLVNYSLTPNCLQLDQNHLHICRPEGCPVLAYGSSSGFESMLEAVNNHSVQEQDRVENRPHLSDQDFICKYFSKSSMYSEICHSSLGVANVFDPDWQQAKLVHYGNPFIIRNGSRGTPKYQLIPTLRGLPGWQIPL